MGGPRRPHVALLRLGPFLGDGWAATWETDGTFLTTLGQSQLLCALSAKPSLSSISCWGAGGVEVRRELGFC